MKQLGNDLPMGAIMTYNKIALVTLEDCGTDRDHESLLEHTGIGLSTGTIQERKTPAKNPGCSLREFSPIREQKTISNTVLTQKGTGLTVFDETEVSREIFYSMVCEDGEVFPSLLQALKMAYERCKNLDILKNLPVVHKQGRRSRQTSFLQGRRSRI
jgi:hypothetical protein